MGINLISYHDLVVRYKNGKIDKYEITENFFYLLYSREFISGDEEYLKKSLEKNFSNYQTNKLRSSNFGDRLIVIDFQTMSIYSTNKASNIYWVDMARIWLEMKTNKNSVKKNMENLWEDGRLDFHEKRTFPEKNQVPVLEGIEYKKFGTFQEYQNYIARPDKTFYLQIIDFGKWNVNSTSEFENNEGIKKTLDFMKKEKFGLLKSDFDLLETIAKRNDFRNEMKDKKYAVTKVGENLILDLKKNKETHHTIPKIKDVKPTIKRVYQPKCHEQTVVVEFKTGDKSSYDVYTGMSGEFYIIVESQRVYIDELENSNYLNQMLK